MLALVPLDYLGHHIYFFIRQNSIFPGSVTIHLYLQYILIHRTVFPPSEEINRTRLPDYIFVCPSCNHLHFSPCFCLLTSWVALPRHPCRPPNNHKITTGTEMVVLLEDQCRLHQQVPLATQYLCRSHSAGARKKKFQGSSWKENERSFGTRVKQQTCPQFGSSFVRSVKSWPAVISGQPVLSARQPTSLRPRGVSHDATTSLGIW